MRVSESDKVFIKSLLELHSRPGSYGRYMQDVLMVDHETSCNPMPHNVVLQRYENFNKFEVVKDFSDHLFGKHMAQGTPVIRNELQKEWDVIKKDLPDGIYVRTYESRHDLLTAVIIGQQGTPYQDGLFVFDLVIPPFYPSTFGPPPNFEDLVIGHFRSRVRDILITCKDYMEGKFIDGVFDERCSIAFRNAVASCTKPLVDAFIKIGALEAPGFLPLSLHVQNTKENLNNSSNYDTNTTDQLLSAHGEDNSTQEVNESLIGSGTYGQL